MKKKDSKKSTSVSTMPGNVSEQGVELGSIKIHENVIATIVRKATCSVEGIIRIAGNTLVDNIAEFVGSRKIHDRAITVQLNGATVSIEVQVNVSYDSHVPTIATEVQKVVIKDVERITGMEVTAVNVVIQELELDEEEEEDVAEV